MGKNIYIVLPRLETEEEFSIELDRYAYTDRERAERAAVELRRDRARGKWGIVPEDVFNRWPMDDICNSPVPEFKGYTYEQYDAQYSRSEFWRDGVLTVDVLSFFLVDEG